MNWEPWAIIKERSDIDFLILTKRIDRFLVSLPSDWGNGYDNVNIGCSVENQKLADYRHLNIREQCIKANVTFWFKNTGSFSK